MTVSGFISGLLDPYGSGFALSRNANRAESLQPQPARGSRADSPQDPDRPDRITGRNRPNEPIDRVELSPQALAAADQADRAPSPPTAQYPAPPAPGKDANTPGAGPQDVDPEAPTANSNAPEAGPQAGPHRANATPSAAPGDAQDNELTEDEQKQVDELEQRDREVRQHEQAHLSAAGPYALGGPTFDFQTGPDGKRYAIGGEVQIDTSPVDGDPEATIQKMETVRAAALAPQDPSGQDRSVAAQAAREIQKARTEQASPQQDSAEADATGAEATDANSSANSSGSSDSTKTGAPDSANSRDTRGKFPYDRPESQEPKLIDVFA